MAVISEMRGSANRDRTWFWLPIIVFALALAAIAAKLIISWYHNHPHGDPDPGALRVAFLTDAAHRAIPPGGVAMGVRVVKSSWERGGCDGAGPGWSPMKVVEKFRTSESSTDQIDAAMAGQSWRSEAGVGGTAEREYEPTNHMYGADALLSSFPGADGTTLWTLELDAAPAENPTNSC